jgi:transposase InsO family protein
MDRMKFIQEHCSGRWSMDELCRRFGVSRKTGYKFVARFREDGIEGLQDCSRARQTQPQRTPAKIEQRVVAAAREFGCWGPRKLVAVLRRRQPEIAWPSKSTVADILRRHGISKPSRTVRPKIERSGLALTVAEAPNDLWCVDFKGWCLSGDRRRCEPLVIGDAYSRYSIHCSLARSLRFEEVWPHFEAAFLEHGLPEVIRSDNGVPFSSTGIAGLSPLSIRWLRLGIRPERTDPGKPQQNGGLERFNLTLEIEAMKKPKATWEEQQRELERFRVRYNQLRPHEALCDRTPADFYERSSRPYPGAIPEWQYGTGLVVRRVKTDGTVKWMGQHHFIGKALVGEAIGFEQFSHRHWALRLGPLEIAIFDHERGDLIRHHRLVWAEGPDGE